MEAIALTDHKCLSGAVEFENACVKNGIQPIYGMELDVSWKGLNGPIVLLVMKREGWSNICRLSSRLMLAENINEAETITFQELSLFQSGLILLTGGQRSILDTYIQRSQNEAAIDWLNVLHMVFNDRLYIELQQHDPQSDKFAGQKRSRPPCQNLLPGNRVSIPWSRPRHSLPAGSGHA